MHDVLALEPWIDILEAALPADQNGLLVRLAWPDDDCSGGDVELGLLPLDGVHPAELLDRAGRLVGRTVGDDGTVWIDGPPSEGELIRLLRQAMEGGSMP